MSFLRVRGTVCGCSFPYRRNSNHLSKVSPLHTRLLIFIGIVINPCFVAGYDSVHRSLLYFFKTISKLLTHGFFMCPTESTWNHLANIFVWMFILIWNAISATVMRQSSSTSYHTSSPPFRNLEVFRFLFGTMFGIASK